MTRFRDLGGARFRDLADARFRDEDWEVVAAGVPEFVEASVNDYAVAVAVDVYGAAAALDRLSIGVS